MLLTNNCQYFLIFVKKDVN